jgi:hypothetical protein
MNGKEIQDVYDLVQKANILLTDALEKEQRREQVIILAPMVADLKRIDDNFRHLKSEEIKP